MKISLRCVDYKLNQVVQAVKCSESRVEKEEEKMLGLEIRFVMQGKEVCVDSFVEAIVRQVRSSVREEISRTLSREQNPRESPHVSISELPRQAVSIREAARLLSVSPRTIHNYISLKAISTVRVGRRVLVPMRSVNEIVSKGISRGRD